MLVNGKLVIWLRIFIHINSQIIETIILYKKSNMNNHNIIEQYYFNNGALMAILIVSMGIIVEN